MSPFGNGLLQSLRTGGIQEMDREGGQWSLTRPPHPAAAATSVLGRLPVVLCSVHGRGGGDGGGDHKDGASLGFPTSSPTGETVRRRSPPVKAQLWPEMSPVMGGCRGRPR